MEKLSYYLIKVLRRLNKPAIKASKIDATARVCSGTQVNMSEMGRYSYLGTNCSVSHTKIGSFCSIATEAMIGGAAHPIDFVSSSTVFCKGKNIMGKNFAEKEFEPYKETIIGNDVWLGSRVTVLAGRKIGNGAIIGAGSVVTKDVGDYEIWAGNPAKLIRKRFSDEIINGLQELKWWEWSDEKISSMAEFFDSPEKLIEASKREG